MGSKSNSIPREKVCVLLPVLNEDATIGGVISQFKDYGYTNILVMDGGSTDDTVSIAKEYGARVQEQRGDGKGDAVIQAVYEDVESEYLVMMDGDGTYHPSEADALVEPLVNGPYQQVIGNRFANIEDGAMTRFNQFGNSVVNWAYYIVNGRHDKDILSGYRAYTVDALREMSLNEKGFGIETELSAESQRLELSTKVVPITYSPRPEESQTNLRPVRDGFIIFKTLYSVAKRSNPLFYFGLISLLTLLLSGSIATYVAYEYYIHFVTHYVLAILSGVLFLFSSLVFMFAILADLIVSLHMEQMRKLRGDGWKKE